MIIVLKVPKSLKDFDTLSKTFPRDINIIAHTYFGDLILQDKDTDEIALAYICPFELVPLEAKSLESVLEIFEENKEAKKEFFKTEKLPKLENKLGKLQEGEIYIPYPHPTWGGDESIDSYKKGEIWTFVELFTEN